MVDKNKIDALISLLGDSDHEVINAVTDNLLQQGIEIIPQLEKVWESTMDEKLQERIENVIHDIQFETTRRNLRRWRDEGCKYILEGAAYLAQFQFPEINLFELDHKIQKIKDDIWLEIGSNLTALEKVKILNYVIFDLHKFKRNSANFYSPQNSFINQVLETRKGNPISLSIVYMAVAYKLQLSIYGVNLPKNFILAYLEENYQDDKGDETDHILFYINPYNRGAILGRKEIDYFIKQQNLKNDKSYYTICHNKDIIIRLINNLMLSYEKLGFRDKIERLQDLSRIF
ncbi:MAG: transglutaminase-like domain-containing protein [Bacteroidales bacterium]|jgi:regulator of sirC expression with transglutaminase-like and TPR domain